MILQSARTVCLGVSHDDGNEISWDRPKITFDFTIIPWWVVELKKTLPILLEEYLVLILCLGCPGLRWMFSDPDLLQNFWRIHLRLGTRRFHLSLALTLPVHWAFGRGVQTRPSFAIPQCLRPICLQPRKIFGKTFLPNWCSRDRSFAHNRVMFDHCSKRYNWSAVVFSEPPFIGCLPVGQKILNISQIAATFHGIRPPVFIQTDCNSAADVPSLTLRTALSAIPFVSERWGVHVQWFHENSSQDLPNSKELSV